MKLMFLGAAHEVTGSCFYLEACGKRILIDCGMEQGPDEYENQEIPVPGSDIDLVLLTHAHIDHSGKLPLLYQRGFGDRSLPQMPRGISVRSCSVTAPISRCSRRSGETGKGNVPGGKRSFRFTTWMTPTARSAVSWGVRMTRS